MKKTIIYSAIALVVIGLTSSGCQKGNLVPNPNEASTSSTVPVSLLLNRLDNEIYNGGGVLDDVSGSVSEYPFTEVPRYNQFYLSTYAYYWGANTYNWSNTASMYSVLKYVNLMTDQIKTQYGTTPNPYTGLAEFFKAYQFIWYTERVGDIPVTQAGNTSILTPTYNTQHDVYQMCLAMLDTANTELGAIVTAQGTATVSGDIYGLTIAQWQKVVNTYKLRVLISLSKRAQDNPDLNIPTQFANIINNPSQYPIMTGDDDNLKYTYNEAYNQYPTFPDLDTYDFYTAMTNTFINTTAPYKDPRLFIAATPAPYQVADTGGKKSVGDFTAYVGADINISQANLLINATNGMYSFPSNLRYFVDKSGATEEPYILIGYPEMCFNIAEAAYLGWISNGLASTWYTNGIKASLAMYNLADGQVLTIGDDYGKVLGTTTVSVTNFLNDTGVVYKGNTPAGLTQILTQKYVSFWQNSGWEAFYNWRRTGVPTFGQGGAGIGTPNNLIPIRWMYPQDEATYNTANWQSAINSQYGGTDDITQPMWLIK